LQEGLHDSPFVAVSEVSRLNVVDLKVKPVEDGLMLEVVWEVIGSLDVLAWSDAHC
jgi:hypothetical protein